MDLLWMIMGVLSSLTLFLYLRQVIHRLQDRKSEAFSSDTIKKFKKDRICPVCHTHLKPNEYLYASIYKAKPEDKVFIKGCKYCYRTPKKEDKKI